MIPSMLEKALRATVSIARGGKHFRSYRPFLFARRLSKPFQNWRDNRLGNIFISRLI